jgi:serine/threonine protein kinase
VVHRDLKPDNVLVGDGSAKLCDFGLAAVLPASGAGLQGIYGTAPFMAPEMLNNMPYKTEVDLWSLGAIAYVFFYGRFPYLPEQKSSNAMKKVVRDGRPNPDYKPVHRQRGERSPSVSKEAESFVRALLNRSAEQRITALAASDHNFVLEGPVHNASLPSLKVLLHLASKGGAFENRVFSAVECNLDLHLDKLHRAHNNGHALPKEDPAQPKERFTSLRPRKASTSDTSAAWEDCEGSRTPSCVSGSSSFADSTATPVWRTSNMSIGGGHIRNSHTV